MNQQIETLSNLPFPKYIEEFDINQLTKKQIQISNHAGINIDTLE